VAGLAGRDQAELLALIAAFRANERPATIMGRIIRGYSEAELTASAEYFSRQGR
jgi:cytochrome c553